MFVEANDTHKAVGLIEIDRGPRTTTMMIMQPWKPMSSSPKTDRESLSDGRP